jgi:hypothetical protein
MTKDLGKKLEAAKRMKGEIIHGLEEYCDHWSGEYIEDCDPEGVRRYRDELEELYECNLDLSEEYEKAMEHIYDYLRECELLPEKCPEDRLSARDFLPASCFER